MTTSEDGAGWLAFFRDLAARGLSGVALVTSDAHRGLTEAIGATLPGAAWQRCRTHYAANLMAATPKSAWGWVRALHSVYNQPDAASVHAQFGRVLDALEEKLPLVAAHLDAACPDILAFTAFPKAVWRQIWADSRTICARRQVTTDPLPRRTIRTSRRPSSASISRTPSRSVTGPVCRTGHCRKAPEPGLAALPDTFPAHREMSGNSSRGQPGVFGAGGEPKVTGNVWRSPFLFQVRRLMQVMGG